MAELIPDALLDEIVGGGATRRRSPNAWPSAAAGLADTVSLVNNRRPDAANFADIVEDLHS